MTSYQYEPLSHHPSAEIRLLSLAPGVVGDPLVGRIDIVHLQDAFDTYEAISYVWGSSEKAEVLICDEKTLLITESLAAVLHKFRLATQARTLWVDQICINQEDLAERGSKVGMMKRIYYNARHVLVYLGPDLHQEATDAKRVIEKMALEAWLRHQIQVRSAWRSEFTHRTNLLEAGLPPRTSTAWSCVRHLFNLEYFERVWVIQEFKMARAGTLYWGDTEMSLALMKEVLENTEIFQCQKYNSGFCGVPELSRAAVLRPQLHDLWTLLSVTRGRKSSEPRDKVYALLGLAVDLKGKSLSNHHKINNPSDILAFHPPLRVDYDLPLKDILISTAKHIVKDSLRLRILFYAASLSKGRLKELPSWVPDWTDTAYDDISTSLLDLGLDATSQRAAIVGFSQDSRVLRTQGLLVGTIRKNGPPLDLSFRGSSNEADRAHSIEETWPLFQALEPSDPFLSTALLQRARQRYWGVFRDPGPHDFLPLTTQDLLSSHPRSTETTFEESKKLFSKYSFFVQSFVCTLTMSSIHDFIIWRLRQFQRYRRILSTQIITNTISPNYHDIVILAALVYSRLSEWLQAGMYNRRLGYDLNLDEELPAFRFSDPDRMEMLCRGFYDQEAFSANELAHAFEALDCLDKDRDDSFGLPWRFLDIVQGKKMFALSSGHLGFGPEHLREGDEVVLLLGARTPFVLRGDGKLEDVTYSVVGEAYVDGIMDGEMATDEFLDKYETWNLI